MLVFLNVKSNTIEKPVSRLTLRLLVNKRLTENSHLLIRCKQQKTFDKCPGDMEKFKPINNNQLYLLPPSIEDFIPADHLARVINDVVETIDVSTVAASYSTLGQKSYSPHLLLKLMFYGYSIGIRSGRKIAAPCEQDTAFMYLASMYKPDFRTINDFRKNNLAFIQQSFIHIVRLCKAMGMAKAGTLILDGTKLKANASAKHTKTKEQYNDWMERIENDIQDILNEAAATDKFEDKVYGNKRGDELPKELQSKQRLKEKIQQAMADMQEEDQKINLTDKDAKFVRSKKGNDLNYNCQAAITEDGIIVSAYTCNKGSDRKETIKSVQSAEENTQDTYTAILADSGYASFDNYEELDKQGKTIYIPDQQMNIEAEKEKNPYHRNHFVYDNKKSCYICPENKELIFQKHSIHKLNKQKSFIYTCKECPECDKQALCTKGTFRQLHIQTREHLRHEIRQRLKSAEGKIKYLKRMLIESVFGNIKHNLNYGNLYLKGLEKTTAEWQLICIGHNLRKLHKLKMA